MLELKLLTHFPHEIMATDEVGRGSLGGPAVIGAVCLKVESSEQLKALLKFLRLRKIQDSKKLSSLERKKILAKLGIVDLPFRQEDRIKIKGIELSYITWDMDHSVIDQENILAASLRGMKEASLHLSDKKNISTTVLIDGHMKLRWENQSSPWHEVPIVKGDSKSLLIALASIIAKEKRDAYMRQMHELYPQYGFANHFGYPTKEHRLAIEKYGPCLIHRKSFKGVKEFVRS